ncbi:Chromosome partition protein Smc [Carpediemonas membranifera]|uniref:Chromosome partition protein Smc n=1 Tax=Carpediemonas membranifera TaxID=201153 RepID=A0A8J6B8W8_9EUKA|nr:Chromosome partition protein Smc [Carpediemonas membranifera]|eukprot:KAG9395192.1 Chromosome partition protein Smc [Carpediemonas membranifera]
MIGYKRVCNKAQRLEDPYEDRQFRCKYSGPLTSKPKKVVVTIGERFVVFRLPKHRTAHLAYEDIPSWETNDRTFLTIHYNSQDGFRENHHLLTGDSASIHECIKVAVDRIVEDREETGIVSSPEPERRNEMDELNVLFDDVYDEQAAYDGYFNDADFGVTPQVGPADNNAENVPYSPSTPAIQILRNRLESINATMAQYGIETVSLDDTPEAHRRMVEALELLCSMAERTKDNEDTMTSSITSLETSAARSAREISRLQEDLRKERQRTAAKEALIRKERKAHESAMNSEGRGRENVELEIKKIARRCQQTEHKLRRAEGEYDKLRDQLLTAQKRFFKLNE